jgi:hypothetical protein
MKALRGFDNSIQRVFGIKSGGVETVSPPVDSASNLRGIDAGPYSPNALNLAFWRSSRPL